MTTIAQPITTQFAVKIIHTAEDGTDVEIAASLAAAITGFSREFDETEEDKDPMGFIVDGDGGSGDEADGDDDDDSDDGPDSTLIVTATANTAMLADMRALNELDDIIKVQFIYGEGAIVREFDVNSDLWVVLNEAACDSAALPLELSLSFECYDSATNY
jgi:hypothetical protein